MINLRRVAASAVAVALGSFVMFSCTQEDVETTPDNAISQEIASGFSDLGYDVSNLEVKNLSLEPGGAPVPTYVLEGDILVEKAKAMQIINDLVSSEVVDGPNTEQYRTSQLVSAGSVSNPRTISVIGYTGSCCALTSKMRTALQWAVDNYNRLNIEIRFSLRFAAATNADMVVYNNGAAGGGGSAGFPSNGNPNKFIQINAGTDAFSTNVNEHVITHEIGHSVGFRHSDYFNRSLSCGSGGNEGTAGVGAILIPGTNQFDATSIMAACFSSSEDGEFNNNDITALRFMY
ncbi:MAG: M57 family metalloprotease [Cyclobacteriaceae bacterium]